MHQEFLMGNEAIALGALSAGVRVVSGYPGTPSTEVLETAASRNPGSVHVEWSVNEKAALEVAAGAAYAGARALVTMKQVGLNVASDPLMSLEYIGVKGGLVVLVADDPGPISSQTEQDTRTFGMYSKIPVLDPSSVAEAYQMVRDAFRLSEEYRTPVILRPTTRIDHGYAGLSVHDPEEYEKIEPEGFIKDSSRWVIFPRLSVVNHGKIEERNRRLETVLSDYPGNAVYPAVGNCQDSAVGVVSQGISFCYVMDALKETGGAPRVLKVGTPFPFPERLAEEFLEGLSEVLVVEELDPVLERALLMLCGKKGIRVGIHGKLDGTVKSAGENTPGEVAGILDRFLGRQERKPPVLPKAPALPVRPPVLCAGCPHRASFYAVKRAMKGQKTIFCGDIGCYTLGNAQPLDMCDTCLCMGAGVNIAQGVFHTEPDTKAFAFVGDSTFFASGISGVVNGFANQADLTLVILDNSTTAMTGHQPHPGSGRTAMGEPTEPVDMERLLKGIGVKTVETVNPLELEKAVETVKKTADLPGVKAIIFRYPCIVKVRPKGQKSRVDAARCVSCLKCIRELGCPALIPRDGKVEIDETLCTGCTLCEQICPQHCISGGEAQSLKAPSADDKKRRAPVHPVGIREEGERESASGGLHNIILAGVGGQGTVLASRLIALAAMKAGIPVKTAETIGMAQRGGSVFSQIRLGGDARSPLIREGQADLILGFEPAEAARMLHFLKPGGTVITGDCPIVPVSAMMGQAPYDWEAIIKYLRSAVKNIVLIDTKSALEKLGSTKALNTLLLGAAFRSGRLGIPEEAILEAIRETIPEKVQELNSRAFRFEAEHTEC